MEARDIKTLPGKFNMEKVGSLWYLVDGEGRIRSEGYHHIQSEGATAGIEYYGERAGSEWMISPIPVSPESKTKMIDKEERVIALLEAHEHLSESIGHRRTGLSNNDDYSEERFEGLKEAQDRVRAVIIDTALMGDEE